MADKIKIGFIGLGTMGARMAGNFQKAGYRLVVTTCAARRPIHSCRGWRDLGRHARRRWRALRR